MVQVRTEKKIEENPFWVLDGIDVLDVLDEVVMSRSHTILYDDDHASLPTHHIIQHSASNLYQRSSGPDATDPPPPCARTDH